MNMKIKITDTNLDVIQTALDAANGRAPATRPGNAPRQRPPTRPGNAPALWPDRLPTRMNLEQRQCRTTLPQ